MNIDVRVAINVDQFLYQPITSNYPFVTGSSTNSNWIAIQSESGDFVSYNIQSNYIYNLNNTNYVVGKKILVKVEKDENNEIICDIPEIELYSFGKNEEEALKQLKLEIIDLFDDLISIPDNQLGASPVEWKKYLKEHIVKKQ